MPRTTPPPTPPRPDNVSHAAAACGRYTLLAEIGHGTLTKVYRARGPDGRIVALKVLSAEAATDRRRLLRFYQGAKLGMQLEHPGLVPVYEVGCDQGRHFAAMEYVDGANLAQYVMRHGPLPERQALEIAMALAAVLEYVHGFGLLHRDVNPANVLMAEDGRVFLTDLGLSKDLQADLRLTADGTGLGTPDYIAPEQFRGTEDLDRRADIYGLGTTLYAMLTRRLPFAGSTLMEKWAAKMRNEYRRPTVFRPDLSLRTQQLLHGAMHADPAKRPANAARFMAGAKACLAGLAPSAEPTWQILLPVASGRMECRQATTAQIAQAIVRGQLRKTHLAARGTGGEFVPLAEIPEFQPLFRIRTPATAPAVPGGRSHGWSKIVHGAAEIWQDAKRRFNYYRRNRRATALAPSGAGELRLQRLLPHVAIAATVMLVLRLLFY